MTSVRRGFSWAVSFGLLVSFVCTSAAPVIVAARHWPQEMVRLPLATAAFALRTQATEQSAGLEELKKAFGPLAEPFLPQDSTRAAGLEQTHSSGLKIYVVGVDPVFNATVAWNVQEQLGQTVFSEQILVEPIQSSQFSPQAVVDRITADSAGSRVLFAGDLQSQNTGFTLPTVAALLGDRRVLFQVVHAPAGQPLTEEAVTRALRAIGLVVMVVGTDSDFNQRVVRAVEESRESAGLPRIQVRAFSSTLSPSRPILNRIVTNPLVFGVIIAGNPVSENSGFTLPSLVKRLEEHNIPIRIVETAETAEVTRALRSLREAAGLEEGVHALDAEGSLRRLQEWLARPEVTGGKGIRARVLRGLGRQSYDALVVDQIPSGLVSELAGGLSPLLSHLNSQGPFTWGDVGGGLGAALMEAVLLFPNLSPILVDAVRWKRDQFDPAILSELEHQAEQAGIDLWSQSPKFLQTPAQSVDLRTVTESPLRLITMMNALAYNEDPLQILTNLYNQLEPDGILVTNLYIPVNYARAGDLVKFYENLEEHLNLRGVAADFRIRLDWSTMGAEGRNSLGESGPFFEHSVGMVLGKQRNQRLEVIRQPKSEQVFVQNRTVRDVTYQVAWYGEDPSQVIRVVSAAGLEEPAGPATAGKFDRYEAFTTAHDKVLAQIKAAAGDSQFGDALWGSWLAIQVLLTQVEDPSPAWVGSQQKELKELLTTDIFALASYYHAHYSQRGQVVTVGKTISNVPEPAEVRFQDLFGNNLPWNQVQLLMDQKQVAAVVQSKPEKFGSVVVVLETPDSLLEKARRKGGAFPGLRKRGESLFAMGAVVSPMRPAYKWVQEARIAADQQNAEQAPKVTAAQEPSDRVSSEDKPIPVHAVKAKLIYPYPSGDDDPFLNDLTFLRRRWRNLPDRDSLGWETVVKYLAGLFEWSSTQMERELKRADLITPQNPFASEEDARVLILEALHFLRHHPKSKDPAAEILRRIDKNEPTRSAFTDAVEFAVSRLQEEQNLFKFKEPEIHPLQADLLTTFPISGSSAAGLEESWASSDGRFMVEAVTNPNTHVGGMILQLSYSGGVLEVPQGHFYGRIVQAAFSQDSQRVFAWSGQPAAKVKGWDLSGLGSAAGIKPLLDSGISKGQSVGISGDGLTVYLDGQPDRGKIRREWLNATNGDHLQYETIPAAGLEETPVINRLMDADAIVRLVTNARQPGSGYTRMWVHLFGEPDNEALRDPGALRTAIQAEAAQAGLSGIPVSVVPKDTRGTEVRIFIGPQQSGELFLMSTWEGGNMGQVMFEVPVVASFLKALADIRPLERIHLGEIVLDWDSIDPRALSSTLRFAVTKAVRTNNSDRVMVTIHGKEFWIGIQNDSRLSDLVQTELPAAEAARRILRRGITDWWSAGEQVSEIRGTTDSSGDWSPEQWIQRILLQPFGMQVQLAYSEEGQFKLLRMGDDPPPDFKTVKVTVGRVSDYLKNPPDDVPPVQQLQNRAGNVVLDFAQPPTSLDVQKAVYQAMDRWPVQVTLLGNTAYAGERPRGNSHIHQIETVEDIQPPGKGGRTIAGAVTQILDAKVRWLHVDSFGTVDRDGTEFPFNRASLEGLLKPKAQGGKVVLTVRGDEAWVSSPSAGLEEDDWLKPVVSLPPPYRISSAGYNGPVNITGKVGGTRFELGVGSAEGLLNDIRGVNEPTLLRPGQETQDQIMERWALLMSGLIRRVGVNRVMKVYLSAPGAFAPDGTILWDQENIPGLKAGLHMGRELQRHLARILSDRRAPELEEVAVEVVHDGTAHANGERSRFGKFPGAPKLFFIGPGSGIATRAVFDGIPFTGGENIQFMANEVPHFLIWNSETGSYDLQILKHGGNHPDFIHEFLPDGTPNPLYGKEDMEDRTSGPGIGRALVQAIREAWRPQSFSAADVTDPEGLLEATLILERLQVGNDREIIRKITEDPGQLTTDDFSVVTKAAGRLAAEEGNPNLLAKEVFVERARELGSGLATTLVELSQTPSWTEEFRPEGMPIVIGGGVSQVGSFYLDAVKEGFARRYQAYVDRAARPDWLMKPKIPALSADQIQSSDLLVDSDREKLAGLPSAQEVTDYAERLAAVPPPAPPVLTPATGPQWTEERVDDRSVGGPSTSAGLEEVTQALRELNDLPTILELDPDKTLLRSAVIVDLSEDSRLEWLAEGLAVLWAKSPDLFEFRVVVAEEEADRITQELKSVNAHSAAQILSERWVRYGSSSERDSRQALEQAHLQLRSAGYDTDAGQVKIITELTENLAIGLKNFFGDSGLRFITNPDTFDWFKTLLLRASA